jgi:hypothetical protein
MINYRNSAIATFTDYAAHVDSVKFWLKSASIGAATR